jgi:uncharacterized coiled-coil DUF342 family protein
LEFRKGLAELKESVSTVKDKNSEINDKYVTILKEFGEVLQESHSYLQRNELFWKVFSLAISDERKVQAVRDMSSLSLTEAERYVKQLQKLEESSTPAANPRRYNMAETAKLREFVRSKGSVQDVNPPKKSAEGNAAGVLQERMLRNAGLYVEED